MELLLRKPWQCPRHPQAVSPCRAGAVQTTSLQQPELEKPARGNRSCGTDRCLLQSCFRQILKPPNLSLTENLHPPGPALHKAHGSQTMGLSAKNTCATSHPARTPAAQRCPGFGFAGCKCEYFQ